MLVITLPIASWSAASRWCSSRSISSAESPCASSARAAPSREAPRQAAGRAATAAVPRQRPPTGVRGAAEDADRSAQHRRDRRAASTSAPPRGQQARARRAPRLAIDSWCARYARHDRRRAGPQLFDQREAQHDRHGPDLADRLDDTVAATAGRRSSRRSRRPCRGRSRPAGCAQVSSRASRYRDASGKAAVSRAARRASFGSSR
jgi:hypothetical protein